MLRTIGGVIVGYLAMVILVFVLLSGAWAVMGVDGAFNAGTFDPSMMWILTTFVLGFIAALVGGMVAAMIGGKGRTVTILAGLVLVLGLLMAIPVAMASGVDPGPRDGAVGMFEAMSKAKEPLWVCLVNPILGAIGVLAGASLKKS